MNNNYFIFKDLYTKDKELCIVIELVFYQNNETYKFLCINKKKLNLLDTLLYDRNVYDGVANYELINNIWVFTIKSKNIDCLSILKQYYGSGDSYEGKFSLTHTELKKIIQT